MIVGYARVSTSEQSLDPQRDALAQAGCERVFADVASGRLAARPQLERLLEQVRPGDVVCAVKLDRLGRSLPHLLEVAHVISERGAGLRLLEQGIDTTTSAGRMVFAMLGAIAEFERELIVERTRAGPAAARARGRVGGRPRKLTDAALAEAARMLATGRTQAEVAAMLGVHRKTLADNLDRRMGLGHAA